MNSLWAVSSGEYSDYGVDFICEREEDAVRLAAELGDRHRAEEFPFYRANNLPTVIATWNVKKWGMAGEERETIAGRTVEPYRRKPAYVNGLWEPDRGPQKWDWVAPPGPHAWGCGHDKDVLLKAVRDRWYQVLAERSPEGTSTAS